MNDEQRQELIRRLGQGEDLSPEWARILFPSEKREYELVYHGKEREEDVIAGALAVPLQKVRTFDKNGDGWHNNSVARHEALSQVGNLNSTGVLPVQRRSGKRRDATLKLT